MMGIKQTFTQFFSMHGSLFRYSLSFSLLMALFPTVIVIITLFQYGILDINVILPTMYQYLPQDLLEPFVDYILSKESSNFISLIISFSITCVLASKSFYSLMLISANMEGFKTYKILIRIKSAILFIAAVVIIGSIAFIATILRLSYVYSTLFSLFIALYLLFRMLSFRHRDIYYGILGALFSSVSIVLVGVLFTYIVSNYMTYQNVYGPISSMMTLILMIYIISNILYFGYCLNFAYGKDSGVKAYKSIQFYHFGEQVIDSFKKVFKR